MEDDHTSTTKSNTPDIQMGIPTSEVIPGEQPKSNTKSRNTTEKARSFKAALLNAHTHAMDCEKRKTSEFEDESDEEDLEEESKDTVSRIKVSFSKEHLQRTRQNHRGCLFIKLLGRNMGYKPLMDRITNIWDLKGLFTPVDLGLGFYLIRFESKADYNKVYTGGPWIIQDHYLMVRKWQLQFKADMAMAIKTVVWMRFKYLPYEFCDEESFLTIAAKLGKPLKVDTNTIEEIQGSYARVCVELDLRQPLETSVAIGKYDNLIEYEHIHLICFSCGTVGHRKESCSLTPTPKKMTAANETVEVTDIPGAKAVKYNGTLVPTKLEETIETRMRVQAILTQGKARGP